MKLERSDRSRFLDELRAQLQARNRDGTYRFADDEVADLLACLVLCSLAAGATDPITNDEEALLLRFADRLGIRGGETAAQLQRALGDQLDRIAIGPALLSRLQAAARALLTGVAEPALARQRVLGGGKQRPPLAPTKPASGAVRAGPAARFQLGTKKNASAARKKKQISGPRGSSRKSSG